jgi:hypothetical protein
VGVRGRRRVKMGGVAEVMETRGKMRGVEGVREIRCGRMGGAAEGSRLGRKVDVREAYVTKGRARLDDPVK